jgi:hypothetical protein
MIKNRELALIPDAALELLDLPATAPAPRTSTSRSASSRASTPRALRRPRLSRRTTRRAEGSAPA